MRKSLFLAYAYGMQKLSESFTLYRMVFYGVAADSWSMLQ